MLRHLPLPLRYATLLAAFVTVAGCGVSTAPRMAPVLQSTTASELDALRRGTPFEQLEFVTVKGVVIKLLAPDNHGLTHQNFIVRAESPYAGRTFEVNNSTTHGDEVPNLEVGDRLTIRGVIYKDKKQDGIHWTHMKDRPGDAGFIKTEDGKIYE